MTRSRLLLVVPTRKIRPLRDANAVAAYRHFAANLNYIHKSCLVYSEGKQR